MAGLIEDYALIGDTETAALVSRTGSIDWLCWPRFDSGACFAALVGDDRHGSWRIRTPRPPRATRRRYRPDTLVLETELELDGGRVRITDCMPPVGDDSELIRVVEALEGEVELCLELSVRFGYGDRRPWIDCHDGHLALTSAPDALALRTPAPVRVHDGDVLADLRIRAGERVPFVLAYHSAHEPEPAAVDPWQRIDESERWWRDWSGRCSYQGPWCEAVRRSLLVLKALTYRPTGAIVAAPTTSLPERLGGVRNWDYRYCWLRDSTLTLFALLDAGYHAEAREFNRWLERTARGEPSRLQILYGVAGERWLPEREIPWLPGYQASTPVRVGNAAALQLQLDVYGELIDCLHHARSLGIPPDPDVWALELALVEHLEQVWCEPDEGMWEVRGPRQHFTYSKVMVWVALDRMIKDAQRFELDGPVAHWRDLRDRVHADVCTRGFDADRGVFVQAYGSTAMDASLLLLPGTGFLPASDPRVRATVMEIRRDLARDGLILRYDSARTQDGLPTGEGVFLPCSFWLVDALHAIGEERAAVELFEHLLTRCNDVGLLPEELDPQHGRFLGNFPQALSHVALVNSAMALSGAGGPADLRRR